MTPPEKFSLVRVRPASAETEGPKRGRLADLVRLFGGEIDETLSETVPFPLHSSPLDPVLVGRLTDAFKSALSSSRQVFVDMCYDRTIELYGVIEWIVYSAIRSIDSEVTGDSHMYIYVDILPGPGERLWLLTHDAADLDRFTFIDSEGRILGESADADLSARLERHFETKNTALSALVKGRFLRLRGVYSNSREETFYKFQYTLPSPFGTRELTQLLTDFLEEKSIDAVVFSDSNSGAWFEECIVAAATRAGISWSHISQLSAARGDSDPALELLGADVLDVLNSSHMTAAWVVPAFKDGRTMAEGLETIKGLSVEADLICLTVILDEGQAGDVTDGWYGTYDWTLGTERLELNYLITAPIVHLPVQGWHVAAAKALGMVQRAGVDESAVSTIAFWSLIDDYPVERERPKPKGRAAVRWFPIFEDLHEWDSHWAASVMLETALEALGGNQSQLLVVIPAERNASAPISTSLQEKLGVAVVRVPRAVLDGSAQVPDKDLRTLRDFTALKIAVMDESSITGATLGKMARIVKDATGRTPDLSLALFSPSKDAHVRENAVFSWRASI